MAAMNPRICFPRLGTGVVFAAGLLVFAVAAPPFANGADRSARDSSAVDFTQHIRPLLARYCTGCHGASKQNGGLRLDTPSGIEEGGDSGPVIEPGKSSESRLYLYVSGQDPDIVMPPEGERLSPHELALIKAWIDAGARLPRQVVAELPFVDDDVRYWAFQPVRRRRPPIVNDSQRASNVVDRFLLARLESVGLTYAPEADRHTLIRRATFDLHGLPASPEAVEEFVRDSAADAYGRLIDRLLASPRYGERWARHWLDLVRYADSDGFKADDPRPHAWRYRDYVIDALNRDLPYDGFVAEQIAGDEMAPDDPRALIATGFLRHWPYEYNQAHVRQQWENILNDVTDVTGQVFLGLTIQCARCHNHKFDPILQADYYRLQAFFSPLLPVDDLPIAGADQHTAYQDKQREWESATRQVRTQMAALEQSSRDRFRRERMSRYPKDIQAILAKPATQRTPLEKQLADLAERQLVVTSKEVVEKMNKEVRAQWQALQADLAKFDSLRPAGYPLAMAVRDIGSAAPPTMIAGVKDRAKAGIEPGFLTILDPRPARIDKPRGAANSTGRRTALARWLIRPDNPLTARVMVNRLWHYHFGRGLVGTPSDLGRRGDQLTHPELLDWLAAEFVASGWSIKTMHRLMLTSAAYRQDSRVGAATAEASTIFERARSVDPDNRLLWRMRLRRLTGEELHDAMLFASGELNLRLGGPGVRPDLPPEVADSASWTPNTNARDGHRRAVYVFVKRNLLYPLFDAFDMPDSHESCACRNVTTTTNQALLLINGEWSLQRARAFADRIGREVGADPQARITHACRLAFGRRPTSQDVHLALQFLADTRDERTQSSGQAPEPGLVDWCHVLLNANEFAYVD
jgi:hypothetical protein